MHFVDLIDAATELAPRRWKRYAAIAFMAAFLLVPNKAADALTWVRQGKGTPDRQGGVGFRRPVANRLPGWDRDSP